MGRRTWWVHVCAYALFFAACTTAEPGDRQAPSGVDSSPLEAAFADAAARFGVPAELLATLSYVETRLRHRVPDRDEANDGHHPPGGIGLMSLTGAEASRGATLAGLPEAAVIEEPWANVRAAAALLAERAGRLGARPATLSDWYPVLAAERGAAVADEVYERLARGVRGVDAAGRDLIIGARPEVAGLVAERPVPLSGRQGYPEAIWSPADSSNYRAASRGAGSIDHIVIHTVQGSYGGAISWFKNPAADVSAHYVVRSSDGEVTQMVDDSDVAWHDACFNDTTIGIEHEGYVDEPDVWYTENLYAGSARLTAYLAGAYGVPLDRDHILGHGEAPDCSSHSDPGSGWDWDHYMDLVRAGGEPTFDAAAAGQDFPETLRSGEEAVVYFELENLSDVTWGLDETRLGTAEPHDRPSPFFDEGNWISESRATGADHSNYAPGAVGRFTFAIRAPEVEEPTTFTEKFQLVQEGVTWFGPVLEATITVVPDGTSEPEPGASPPVEPEAGGCQAAPGQGPWGCAILLLGALLLGRRRRRSRR